MKKEYDVVIVGGGPSGSMAAYELTVKNPGLSVLLIDKGNDIYHRNCPILEKKLKKCPVRNNGEIGCLPNCSITNGFGGAGAYSDGKFNITSEYGGWMSEYMDDDRIEELIGYVDQINLGFGAPLEITDPTTEKVREIERRGLAVGLKLLRGKVRHLGTEINLEILRNLYEYLRTKIDMVYKTEVQDVIVNQNQVEAVLLANKEMIKTRYVIITPGRDGSKWLSGLCNRLGIGMHSNHVDIGVRVETNNEIMAEINKHLYEGKFIYQTSGGLKVRTFCSNPSGHVVIENHSGTVLANGHAYTDSLLGSKNTNFALLVSHSFTEPFNQPNEFAHGVSRLANMLSNGSIIIQRYGDLKRGRRSTDKRIKEGFVIPTLKEAVPGDLGLVLPYKSMKAIMEMIEALDHVTPGIASEHTLFYGVEAKFYSARPEVNDSFESMIRGLYFGGDGAGITRGLAQASANGIWIARDIAKRG
ncbi:MAG: NAD(P)/FAD-dependent oxidoreductase [Candidatus Izemoplasmatales bacterium]|nr:NAD(P)/FAD-dependent oxidoreductase [bacterium]MDZ4195916.1 NAD(P)/FAD-dependent oxidoreductase [Candidatus Izemoplasmatales bacterium]